MVRGAGAGSKLAQPLEEAAGGLVAGVGVGVGVALGVGVGVALGVGVGVGVA